MSISVPPPPVLAMSAPVTSGATIRTYVAGPPRCEDGPVAAERREQPVPDGIDFSGSLPEQWQARPITLHFEIAADGRPLSIRSDAPQPPYGANLGDDVEPAFAAWRFAAGAPRTGCIITFESRDVAVAEAEPRTLQLYLATRASPAFGFAPVQVADAARARIRPADASCPAQPGSRIWYWPDFDRIPQPEGTLSWSFLAFDVDSHGKARGLRLLGSSGNPDLDRRSLSALRHSVFTQPATGCTFNFYRNPGERMPPPPDRGELAVYRDDKATCEKEELPLRGAWTHMAPLDYPRNLGRRGIQGWAVVSYDVAPWGQTGNVRVLDSQPASGFGEAGRRIVEQSVRRPAAYGYTGCLERIRFVLPPPGPRVR
jgi:TonB family protein